MFGISVGHIATQLSAANYYGLVELKQKEGYKPTELFKSIYKSHTDEEKHQAKVTCLTNPELYQKIIQKYNGGRLPEISGLAILLYRDYKVAEDASERAARIFLQNVEDLKLLDDERILDLSFRREDKQENDSNLQDKDAAIANPPYTPNMQTATINNNNTSVRNIQGTSFSIPIISKNLIASLALPSGLDINDLEDIIEWLTFYKEQAKKRAINQD